VDRVQSVLQGRFDPDGDGRALVQTIRPIWAELNPVELRRNGVHLDAMSRYLADRTLSQVGKPGLVRPGQGGARAFDAVFAGSILPHLDCSD
jgi:hypothetical protein